MLVLDLEIKNAIWNKKQGPKTEGLKYCKGWTDYEGMGISVLVVYDYVTGRYRTFMDDNKDEFNELLKERKYVVGFNQINFDNNVLSACWESDFSHIKNYDMLKKTWEAVGVRDHTNKRMHAGYGLGPLCEANFGTPKSASGAMAPIWWQEGKVGAVIDYCHEDVRLTRNLFEKASREPLIDPKDPTNYLGVEVPELLKEIIYGQL